VGSSLDTAFILEDEVMGQHWSTQEVKPKYFNDLRHSKRLSRTLKLLGNNPNKSVPEAAGSDAEGQAIYRFWSNKKVTEKQILASHRASVVSRSLRAGVVLAIQDTTDLDYSTLSKTEGLGHMHQGEQQGIKVHTCFAVSGAGEPLGLLDQYCWNRPERTGKAEKRRQTPIQEKESNRWLKGLRAAEQGLEQTEMVIHVADREADIFELFALERGEQSELLIRLDHNRGVDHELKLLIPTVNQAPILGDVAVEIDRNPKRKARTANLTLRGQSITIKVPLNHPKPHNLEPVTVNVVLAEETKRPEDGSDPIRWLLLTTLPIDSFEQAWQVVRWYSYRWLIERFHFTLKSGCQIEALQLEDAAGLIKALATYSIIAWRLMWLTYKARLSPDESCEPVVSKIEWKLLRRKFEPMNRSKKPPTLHQAIVWIARLGGFLARKGDGDPGLKTLWRGLGKLSNLLEGAQLASGT
jgi:hypothetical protein